MTNIGTITEFSETSDIRRSIFLNNRHTLKATNIRSIYVNMSRLSLPSLPRTGVLTVSLGYEYLTTAENVRHTHTVQNSRSRHPLGYLTEVLSCLCADTVFSIG